MKQFSTRMMVSYYLLILSLICQKMLGQSFLLPQISPSTKTIKNDNNDIIKISSRRLTIQIMSAQKQGYQNQRQGMNTERSKKSMKRRQQSLEEGHHPLKSLNLNLDALAKQQGAAPRAQELLQRIHALYQEGYYAVSPDIVSYNSVLKAWKESDEPENALELLLEMLADQDRSESSGGQHNPSIIQANVISFNTVLLAFAQQGNYQQANNILEMMKQRNIKPDSMSYNALLYAHAQSTNPKSAMRAETILREMIASNVAVDTTSFNTVLHAWTRTHIYLATPAEAAAKRVEHLIQHMESMAAAGNPHVRPDIYSYTTAIHAWSRCNNPDKAREVFDHIIQQQRDVNPSLALNRVTYTALITSFAKGGRANDAQFVLEEMIRRSEETGDESIKPDTIAFSSVIQAWSKSAQPGDMTAPEEALRLLRRMQKLEKETGANVRPNAQTYTPVLSAFAKCGAWDSFDRVMELLEEMEKEYSETGNKQICPSVIHYNIALQAHVKGPKYDKAKLAWNFLNNNMRDHSDPNCHPDSVSYNAILLACANSFGPKHEREKILQIAIDAFKTVVSSNDPLVAATPPTFSYMIKSLRKLSIDRDKAYQSTKSIFDLCCKMGLVSLQVLQQVSGICKDAREWEELLGLEVSKEVKHGNIQLKSLNCLPKEWKCNVQ